MFSTFKLTVNDHEIINVGGGKVKDVITIENGVVDVNGINMGRCDFNLEITPKGTLSSFKSEALNVKLNGNVGKIVTNGSVNVHGNVENSINTTGSVTVSGDVGGSINTMGAVNAGNVKGNITTMGKVSIKGK